MNGSSWVVTVLVGGLALVMPLALPAARLERWLWPTLLGTAAFASVGFLWAFPDRAGRWVVVAAVAAGVAEEAVFRRALYGYLERWGAPMAVTAAAIAFGLVHVPMYGWAALPLDVAAGLVFGWQRWASGTWTSPAATHAVANLVAYL